MSEATPRPEDFDSVREQLRDADRAYERALVRAQGIGDEAIAIASRRRRALVGELLEFLEAREELGDMVLARAAVGAPLPPGGWLG